LSNGQEIKVEIYFKEIQSNLDRGLIVQSNDISETLTRINTIEVQNEKLRSIAWTQSHVVRAPLSRILGIVNLIEQKTDNLEEILYWVKQLRISTEEMDTIVKKIINETNSLKEN
jgi:signal transduction histidine kinase